MAEQQQFQRQITRLRGLHSQSPSASASIPLPSFTILQAVETAPTPSYSSAVECANSLSNSLKIECSSSNTTATSAGAVRQDLTAGASVCDSTNSVSKEEGKSEFTESSGASGVCASAPAALGRRSFPLSSVISDLIIRWCLEFIEEADEDNDPNVMCLLAQMHLRPKGWGLMKHSSEAAWKWIEKALPFPMDVEDEVDAHSMAKSLFPKEYEEWRKKPKGKEEARKPTLQRKRKDSLDE